MIRWNIELMSKKLDPYDSAERSPFNIHREPPRPTGTMLGKGRTVGKLSPPKERKVGTLSDITGEN